VPSRLVRWAGPSSPLWPVAVWLSCLFIALLDQRDGWSRTITWIALGLATIGLAVNVSARARRWRRQRHG
jgi:hypothetical protein